MPRLTARAVRCVLADAAIAAALRKLHPIDAARVSVFESYEFGARSERLVGSPDPISLARPGTVSSRPAPFSLEADVREVVGGADGRLSLEDVA